MTARVYRPESVGGFHLGRRKGRGWESLVVEEKVRNRGPRPGPNRHARRREDALRRKGRP